MAFRTRALYQGKLVSVVSVPPDAATEQHPTTDMWGLSFAIAAEWQRFCWAGAGIMAQAAHAGVVQTRRAVYLSNQIVLEQMKEFLSDCSMCVDVMSPRRPRKNAGGLTFTVLRQVRPEFGEHEHKPEDNKEPRFALCEHSPRF